jgi:hypothetical protein
MRILHNGMTILHNEIGILHCKMRILHNEMGIGEFLIMILRLAQDKIFNF